MSNFWFVMGGNQLVLQGFTCAALHLETSTETETFALLVKRVSPGWSKKYGVE